MNDAGYKEVYFNKYCELCKYYEFDASEYPCDECMSNPTNLYSHKPINFEEVNKQ